MPLFGKKEKKLEMPEVVDFSNDTWSYKGEPPAYQIQSDGFTYDIVDSDGNDKNAISLGIAGMLIIVLNAKSQKIREDELLPQFGKVIKTRNWHTMSVKEANFLVQTAIKKLTSSATSGDVFDLASYAPLEVKRSLLKTLFTVSRMQLKPEFREEAEHRVIDDIVPEIFASPEYELAMLTGLIVKPDEKTPELSTSTRIETTPILDTDFRYSVPSVDKDEKLTPVPVAPLIEEDSAFAELQKIYGRKADTPQVRAAAAERTAAAPETPSAEETASASVSAPQLNNPFAQQEPVSDPQTSIPNFSAPQPNNPFGRQEPVSVQQTSAPNFSAPQPNNPFARQEPVSGQQTSVPNFSAPQPNNPFAQQEPRSIPQPGAPGFSGPQLSNPFAQQEPRNIPQGATQNFSVPQPPVPNFGMQQGGNPYFAQNPQGGSQQNPQFPQGGASQQNQAQFPQVNPYPGNFPQYPGQIRQQNPQQAGQQAWPPQMWQQNMQGMQNPQMQQNFPNVPQNFNQNGEFQAPYPGWLNRGMNFRQPQQGQQPQQPQQSNQNPQNSENA